jgi:hypothetical protein
MADYRAYIVGQDGHFQTFKVVEAENDEAAVSAAKQFVEGHDVEVWYLARKIAVLKSDEVS